MKRIIGHCKNFLKGRYFASATLCHKEHIRFDDNGKIIGDYDKVELKEDLKERLRFSIHELPEGNLYDDLLDIIYEPEDIVIIRNMLMVPEPVSELAKRIDMPLEILNKKIDDIAYRGLIIDLMMGENNETRYIYLPEYIVGWMETSINYFLQHKDSVVDKIDFRRLMHMYYHFNEMYGDSLNSGPTKTFRAAPHSVDEDVTFIDYETAQGVIEATDDVGLLECICKGLTKEKGEPFDDSLPIRCCMVLGSPVVEAGVKIGLFERITKEKGLEILKELSDLGHAHCVHNSKRPTSICNCHKDYCQLLVCIRRYGYHGVIEKSNFEVAFDEDKCTSCGVCVDTCIVDVIEMAKDVDSKKKFPTINEDLCLGCGMCVKNCEDGALKLVRRDPPLDYPECYFTTVIEMAFEKNKLNTLLFSDPNKLSHKMMRGVLEYIESNPLAVAVKNIDSVNSVFLKTIRSIAMKKTFVKDYYISRWGNDKEAWKVPDLPKSEHKVTRNAFKGQPPKQEGFPPIEPMEEFED